MVILINTTKKPFKIQYKKGSKSFIKQIPVNHIVAMKDLDASKQISNKVFLSRRGVTIWDYESGTFYHKNNDAESSLTTLPFLFVGNNVKPTSYETITAGYSGNTVKSGMTFVADNFRSSALYGITTSANTVMADATISATTIGNNTFVSFSGASTTTQDVYGALTGSSFSGYGITITGQGATQINTGATITFYVSATTIDLNSPYVYLQGLV